MATPEAASTPATAENTSSLAISSHDTAICIVPPRQSWPPVDRLRSLYDKAYEKWPPHVNLIYPFVRADSLPAAAERIQSVLCKHGSEMRDALYVSLDAAGVFTRRHDNIIYLRDSDEDNCSRLKRLRSGILNALGHEAQAKQGYQMHMTVAQSEDVISSAHMFLLDKVGYLPPVEWEVEHLFIVVRERVQLDDGATSQMKIWGTIRLADGKLSRPEKPLPFYEIQPTPPSPSRNTDEDTLGEKYALQAHDTYYYDDEMRIWAPFADPASYPITPPTTFGVSSYNVLAEFHHPPSSARYPLLVGNMLSIPGRADILVLQEVTDHFLSFLLSSPEIQSRFPFCSHGPPSQRDIEPLPSFLNQVILSRFPFSCDHVSFRRRHKGSLVARFPGFITNGSDSGNDDLIIASVHLTCGLTDGSIAAKASDVQRIVRYLTDTHADSPWVVAGDFNISTSQYTIDAAREKGTVSASSLAYLAAAERILGRGGLVDAWRAAGSLEGEDEGEAEGEQGATYDPRVNEVAAAIVGSGYGMRPQRYDRVYVRGEGLLRVGGFNRFGMKKGRTSEGDGFASDHWGVRAVLEVTEREFKLSNEIEHLVVPVEAVKAQGALADGGVKGALEQAGAFPTEEETRKRKTAFNLLKAILLDSASASEETTTRAQPAVVIAPVGSYALGVWTTSSDLDVLCIGPFSTQTFFALATQRLRKAAAAPTGQDVRILRRVKANTGTMLEIDVHGIKMDLQYCPATEVAEQWPQVLRAPASHAVWSLSASSLNKLKAVRDMDYIRRSVPDLAIFRLAHRFIKMWAKASGVYSARFGYLGGIQISLLLARVYKLMPNPSDVTLPDLLATFFTHYAAFPFEKSLVFDPYFHTVRLPFARSTREPLAILGYFPPSLNTTPFASVPSTKTLSAEFRRAASLLLEPGTTWTSFLTGDAGPVDFLTGYKTYIKISVQYWGLSLSRGSQLIGWIESRCVMLLVDVARRAHGVSARIWPARFVETSPSATAINEVDGESRDYTGSYLVGLDKTHDSTGKEDLQVALSGLRAALRRWEESMRADERYFDARNCWLAAELVNRTELGPSLTVDAREWGEYTPGDEEDDGEDEEDEDQDSTEEIASSLDRTSLSSRKNRKSKSNAATLEEAPPKLEPGRRFRTAADVMNRLRWDPHLDSADFVVGYEDRFVGAREKALDAWKSEQTDEEFIPQHRILYYKRKSDGVIVWERRTRKDDIFGSGV